MYDKVSKQLFKNQGEGSFVIGPDKGNPYVKDGLVAMWDGEWNIGLGMHDTNASVWKDLVGNMDLSFTSAATICDTYVYGDGTSWIANSSDSISFEKCRTIEIVFSFISRSGGPYYNAECIFSTHNTAS